MVSKASTQSHLSTELEIGDDDGNLRAGNHQNNEDQKQEPKQVIIFLLPDRLKVSLQSVAICRLELKAAYRKDEEQFDKHGAEW